MKQDSLHAKGRHGPEHMARMTRAAGTERIFTPDERQWVREHWDIRLPNGRHAWTVESMATQLRTSVRRLKREASPPAGRPKATTRIAAADHATRPAVPRPATNKEREADRAKAANRAPG